MQVRILNRPCHIIKRTILGGIKKKKVSPFKLVFIVNNFKCGQISCVCVGGWSIQVEEVWMGRKKRNKMNSTMFKGE